MSMNFTGYPVVAEHRLPPARRRLLLGGKRDLADLPPQEPGTVLVFEVNGHYEAFRERRHLTGSEDAVVLAVAISVVDMRERLATTRLLIPSNSPADDFVVEAVFRAKVTRPEAVAAAGLTDLDATLRSYLSQDQELLALGLQCGVEEINEVRSLVRRRIMAYCKVVPPQIDGMDLSLREVRVPTPTPLREHSTVVRDERWNQDVVELRQALEQRDVERIHEILQGGPSMVTALGISRREIHTSDAAREAYESEDRRRKHMLDLLRTLPDGYLDSLPIDAMQFVTALSASLRPGATGDPVLDEEKPQSALRRASRDADKPPILDEDGHVD
ncbi:hypothetical protein AB0I53_44400 [Saccharopolyspora sp. NPDC050389]|uniref:hypothetical protein n=1 Tax=Saccharopolyspora sp. NPDC050389 TaxID=3155516 RepID=UPI0033F747C7